MHSFIPFNNSSFIQRRVRDGGGKIKEILGNLNFIPGFSKIYGSTYFLGIKPQYPCLLARKMLSNSVVNTF